MTIHLVTGATGFVGRHLVRALLNRGSTVCAVVRSTTRSPEERIEETLPGCLAHHRGRFRAVEGDVTQAHLGVAPSVRAELAQHRIVIWHLAAHLAFKEQQKGVSHLTNVVGTENVVALANDVGAHLYYVSTAFVRGRNDYERSKAAAEQSVHARCRIPYTIFRPSIIVGDAREGKADGCTFGYYRVAFMFYAVKRWVLGKLQRGSALMKTLLRLAGTAYDEASDSLRVPWLVLAYPDRSRIHLVPLDYVIDAMIAVEDSQPQMRRMFHLVHPRPPAYVFLLRSLLEDIGLRDARCFCVPPAVFNAFCRFAHLLLAPFGRIDDTLLMYLPYITDGHAFSREDAGVAAPCAISRKLLRKINRYAQQEVFGNMKSRSLLGMPRARSLFLIAKPVQAGVNRHVQQRPDQKQDDDQLPRRGIDRRQEQQCADDRIGLVQQGHERPEAPAGERPLADSQAPLKEAVRQLEQGVPEPEQDTAEQRVMLEREGEERSEEEHGEPAAHGDDQDPPERLRVSQESLATPRPAAIQGLFEDGEPVVPDDEEMMDEAGCQDRE